MKTAPAIRTELVSVKTADGSELDGAWYSAAGEYRPMGERTVVYVVHGRTMNFYTGLPRALPAELVPAGYDVLALNQRASGVLALRDDLRGVGDARCSCAEVMADVEAGLEHLKALGYRRVVIAGHSSGAFYAGHVGALEPAVEGIVLASPFPFYSAIPLPKAEWGPVLEQARRMVEEGRGEELILLPRGPSGFTTWVISAATALEAARPPMAPLFSALAECRKPTLVLFGDDALEQQLKQMGAPLLERTVGREVVLLEGTGHFYKGRLAEVAKIVRRWAMAKVPSVPGAVRSVVAA